MKTRTSIRTLVSSVLLFSLTACFDGGGGGGGSTSPTQLAPASTGEITGQVLNGANGQAVAAASVSAGGQTTTTAADGSYTLQNVTVGDRVVVSVSGAGFADQSKIVRLSSQDPNASLPVSMLPIGLTQTFNPDAPQTLTVTGSPASVELAASSLVQGDGSAPSGNVTVNLTVIDPTVDIELMPGDMLTDAGGVLSPIESFGAIIVTFADDSGNDLNLAQGSTANIRIPLADKTGAPPATIPLYFYDETSGVWVEEGTATLVVDAAGSYYEGTVSHFTTWNADFLYDQVLVNGCIEDSAGVRVAGAGVVSVGDDYAGTSSAITDASGNFSIIVKPNASVLVFGLQAGVKTNTERLTTTTSEQTMGSCLVFSTGSNAGDTSVSIKLSWGDNPSDLDAYLVGPGGVRVYFGAKGSLTAFPFSQLDVDDVSSFGPEVITIFNFPEAGTYRYSVNNFSGTFAPGITDSPARIELNVNGTVTLFTPPPGEGTNVTWDVFEFVVAGDGSFVVNPVNTWSAAAP